MCNLTFINNNYIIFSYGFILELSSGKLLYPKNRSNYVIINNIKYNMDLLIILAFNKYIRKNYKTTKIKKLPIYHKDGNILNNDILNLEISRIYNHKKYKPLDYLLLFDEYDLNNVYLNTYYNINFIPHVNKLLLIKSFSIDNKYFNIFNKKIYKYRIMTIDIRNSNNYRLICNHYYISKNYTHIFNSKSQKLINIFLDKPTNHQYVNLFINKKYKKFILNKIINYSKYNFDSIITDNILTEDDIKYIIDSID